MTRDPKSCLGQVFDIILFYFGYKVHYMLVMHAATTRAAKLAQVLTKVTIEQYICKLALLEICFNSILLF
jgi:hypothetical protein